MRKEKVKEYTEKFANPFVAASKGYIDSVIEPAETRRYITHAIEVSDHKDSGMPRKKHGLIPF